MEKIYNLINKLSILLIIITLKNTCLCQVFNDQTFMLANKENLTLDNTFNLPSSTNTIFIFKCSIIKINENAFETLINVTDLTFSENFGVDVLPKELFKNNYYLENLYLIKNNLTALEEGTFSTLPNLKHLDLSFNKLSTLPKKIFEMNIMLSKLIIQRNQLKELKEDVFYDLIQVKTIDLAFNKLKKISSSLFKYNYQLETVSLQGNNIKHLDYGIEHLNLRSFNLHSNPLDLENKKVIEVIKNLNENDVITGIHLHHHKNKIEEDKTRISTDFLLITLISITILLSGLVGYLIYIIKTSTRLQNNCLKFHTNMDTLSRENLVNEDVWTETEINSNVTRN